MTRMIAH